MSTVRSRNFPTGPAAAGAMRKAGISTQIVGKNGYGQVAVSLTHAADADAAVNVLTARFPGRAVTTEVYDHPTGVYRHVTVLIDQT